MSQRVRGAIDIAPSPTGSDSVALDLSAGDGLSSRLLAERGWRVISTERRTARPGWVAADLNYDLPFRAATFELVMMLEVIEHLPDIPHALSEVARVLKPGGTAILSTPNRLNITSRIHYLLTGFYKGRRAPLPYRYKVEDGRNWHVMGLNDFHWMAHGVGLRMDALGRSRRKLRARIFAPIFYPLVRASSWLLYGRRGRDPEQRRINRELLGFMTSASLLMDENIVMRFRKSGADESSAGAGRSPN
ncbi:MAG TPA: class I SAM-dependent methyltransferase [Candidatus Binataceae bacterium]|nr:class I SAM-dependent methyltransferase [Candidatus Binataceae bacterium]